MHLHIYVTIAFPLSHAKAWRIAIDPTYTTSSVQVHRASNDFHMKGIMQRNYPIPMHALVKVISEV